MSETDADREIKIEMVFDGNRFDTELRAIIEGLRKYIQDDEDKWQTKVSFQNLDS